MSTLTDLLSSRAALRLRLPVFTLVALLQRSPVGRLVTAAADALAGAGPGNGFVLRASVASAAALGAIDSLAGATSYVLQSTTPTPVSAQLNQAVGPIGFTVSNTINTGSWRITGVVPPGLSIIASEGGNTISAGTYTGSGALLDATAQGSSDGYGGTTGGNSQTTPILQGTATAAGTYTINLTAYEFGGGGGLVSPTYSFVVTVSAPVAVPQFTTSPANQTVTVGANVTFTAAASSGATYQWQKNGTAISGATLATYTISNAQASDAATYTVVATDSAGSVSAQAVLTVNPAPAAPAFVVQPTTETVITGGTAIFAASASGASSYQWLRNGAAIAGATSATLVVSNVTAANSGTYTVQATNSVGTTTSTQATLGAIATNDFGRLVNLSVLTPAGSTHVLTLGFFTGGGNGSGQQPLLIRATGPALAAFGVANVLADPNLTVISQSSQATVATNDNWGTPAANVATINTADSATGAFGLSTSASLDAALVTPLAPGGYSVQVSGAGTASGNTLAEVYDYTPAGTFTPNSPRLVNLSCLGSISGTDTLTAGFTVNGGTSRSVLVRATGPALAGFGVAGTMPDPKIVLVATQTQTVVATNAGWGGDANVTALGNRVGAFALSDPNSKDSAVVMTLPPGTYTATASSASGTGGSLLVEIYEVP